MVDLSYKAVALAIEDFCHTCDTPDPGLRYTLKDSLTKRPDPSAHSDATSFALHWAAYNLLRKSPQGGLPGSSKARTVRTLAVWINSEKHCARSNLRISQTFCNGSPILSASLGALGDFEGPTLSEVILTSQRKIKALLGPFSFDRVTEECRWSQGATQDLRRGTNLGKRISGTLSVTPSAMPYLREIMSVDHRWVEAYTGLQVEGDFCPLHFSTTNSSRSVEVAKTRDVNRIIAAEPTGNAFLQQGVGRLFRRLLKRVTVDLDDQSYNQFCAGMAHKLGLATLDLESASDTISVAIVKLLLPSDWYNYLSDIRCSSTKMAGKTYHLEKFSSMGNAFTFELESLIFWSLCSSVTQLYGYGDANLAIYGDDIIVPAALAPQVINLLNFCGFKINSDKSFIDGPFFESCGKHFFLGQDVTPPMITKDLESLPAMIRYHNKIVRWVQRLSLFSTRDIPWRCLVAPCERLPEYRLFKQPSWVVGDFGFIASRRQLAHFPYCSNKGYACTVLVEVRSKERVPEPHHLALYAYKLRRSTYSNSAKNGHPEYVGQGGSWRRAVMHFPRQLS